jgi:hypothetical protein
MGGGVGIICMQPAARLMTSTDRNDLMPAQEKLEWVTPKISQMVAEETAGSKPGTSGENVSSPFHGPSCPNLPQTPPHLQKPVIAKGLPRPFFIELRSFAALITWHGCC